MPSTATALECKTLCLTRCLSALALSLSTQFLLLTVFLLCINFHILQPIQWITQTMRLMFSFYTWLSIIPLLAAVLLYGILLGQSQLAVRKYHPSRFQWVMANALRKVLFLAALVAVGFLTAWLYARFLHVDYRHFTAECYGKKCVNSYYVFLIGAGIAASLCHYSKKHLREDPEVEFPIIQELKLVQIRSLLYVTLYKSLQKSFWPTLSYALAYWLLGCVCQCRVASLFDMDRDERLDTFFSTFTSWRLLFYTWILTSQIASNLHLMQHFFAIFLAAPHYFAVEKNSMQCDGAEINLTLVEALAMEQVPLVQHLAAQSLYSIANEKETATRQQIFSLSVPGGHPYNWNQLAGQSLAMINGFIDELNASVEKISNVKTTPLYANIKTSASDTAEKILLRQYNQTNGIRQLLWEEARNGANCANNNNQQTVNGQAANVKLTASQRINEQFEQLSRQIDEALRTAFRKIPGLYYAFGEPDGAMTAYMLSNSHTIGWLVQGLAGICATSLVEDRYGVVQALLPQIVKTLLRFKLTLDKLNNVNLNGNKCNRDLITLRNAVKRSLYKICAVFGDYLRELVDDHEDLRRLQSFASYQET